MILALGPPTVRLAISCLIVTLSSTVLFAVGEKAPLTLDQLLRLVELKVPDVAVAREIRTRRLGFSPDVAALERLRLAGAGPLVESEIKLAILGSTDGRDSEPPWVQKLPRGAYVLRLTPQQLVAVSQVLSTGPSMRIATYDDVGPGAEDVAERMQCRGCFTPEMQFPYACWGDLNRDGFQDVVVVLVSRSAVNNWGWREWWIVVLEGTPGGTFDPIVVAKEQNGCLAGVLYHPDENVIEFACFGVAAGNLRWDGKRYLVTPMVGD